MTDRSAGSGHVEREATITLRGSPGDVFPLFGPIREAEWAEGWRPTVYHRGQAGSEADAVEVGAVFTQPKGNAVSHWLLTTWDQQARRVEYAVVVPGSWVCRIMIVVAAGPAGGSTATVRYEYTGLDAPGLKLVAGYTQKAHEERIASWGRAIDHYLATGTRLRAPHD